MFFKIKGPTNSFYEEKKNFIQLSVAFESVSLKLVVLEERKRIVNVPRGNASGQGLLEDRKTVRRAIERAIERTLNILQKGG